MNLGKVRDGPATHPRHYPASHKLLLKGLGVRYSSRNGGVVRHKERKGGTGELVKPKCIFRRIHALHVSLVFQSKRSLVSLYAPFYLNLVLGRCPLAINYTIITVQLFSGLLFAMFPF